MGSINKVILIGNLGADPELKYTPASAAVCNFSIATTETWKDKSGEKQEKTEWHRIVVWRELAENCSKYLSKGRSVYVEGKMQTRTYEKDGIKRYTTEVVAHNVVFLGGGKGERTADGDGDEGRSSRGRRDDPPPSSGGGGAPPGGDDDIPF